MTTRALTRLTLLLSLLGGTSLTAVSAAAAPWQDTGETWPSSRETSPSGRETWPSRSEPHLRWVQAQRELNQRLYQQNLERLNALERCLGRVRVNRSRELCLRRDQRARELQQQEHRHAWDSLQRRLELGDLWFGRNGF